MNPKSDHAGKIEIKDGEKLRKYKRRHFCTHWNEYPKRFIKQCVRYLELHSLLGSTQKENKAGIRETAKIQYFSISYAFWKSAVIITRDKFS